MSPDLTDDPAFDEVEDPRQRAFLLALVATAGHVGRAAGAAGVSRWTVWRWKAGYDGRPPDPTYLRALAVAEELAALHLQDVAIERATQGLRSYKFHAKTGEPLRHPTVCECGHAKDQHVAAGPCAKPDCGCGGFVGEPYYELDVSDKLTQFLLRGSMPQKYAERHELHGLLRTIDVSKLPDAILQRIIDGEDVVQVLLAATADRLRLLTDGGAGEEDP